MRLIFDGPKFKPSTARLKPNGKKRSVHNHIRMMIHRYKRRFNEEERQVAKGLIVEELDRIIVRIEEAKRNLPEEIWHRSYALNWLYEDADRCAVHLIALGTESFPLEPINASNYY